MATRPSWRGYLRLSLVTCPVVMLPATSEAEKVRFHTLNRATGNRVHSQYVDAETGKPVDEEDHVKGYEREDGEYVLLEDEELDAVALESTRTIDIDCFVPSDSIGWIQLADGVPMRVVAAWALPAELHAEIGDPRQGRSAMSRCEQARRSEIILPRPGEPLELIQKE
jgi:Ku70/Ku80 beta-barrel domain